MTDNFSHEFKTIEVLSIPLNRKKDFILATLQEQFLVNSSRPDSNYTIKQPFYSNYRFSNKRISVC